MPSGKQILIKKLYELSIQDVEHSNTKNTEILKACILLHGSHTPDNLECVSKICYGTKKQRNYGPEKVNGLMVKDKNILFSDLVYEIANSNSMYESMTSIYPDLTYDEYWGALHAVSLILRALEWNSVDAIAEQKQQPGLDEKLIKQAIKEMNEKQSFNPET